MEEVENQIFWTNRAKLDLNKIYDFNVEVMPESKAWEIVVALFGYVEEKLSAKIDIGMPDHQFSHIRKDYKKLLHGNYKITYRIEGTSKYVLRIFDQRQHPDKNL